MSPTRCVAALVCPFTWQSKHVTPSDGSIERRASSGEDSGDILQDTVGLGLDVAGDHLTGGRIDRNLAGDEQEIAVAHGLRGSMNRLCR